MSPMITLLGLGPGNPNQLTQEAVKLLESISEIYLLTSQHPSVEGFPVTLQVHSFDALYETQPSFDQVYAHIIDQMKDADELTPGDFVFFRTPSTPSHVGIYLGKGQFLHAPYTGEAVRTENLLQGYWRDRFIGAGHFYDRDI